MFAYLIVNELNFGLTILHLYFFLQPIHMIRLRVLVSKPANIIDIRPIGNFVSMSALPHNGGQHGVDRSRRDFLVQKFH